MNENGADREMASTTAKSTSENVASSGSLSTKSLLQLAPRAAVGITAVCFCIGLLIVNIRLAKYGVYSAELIRTEYVLTGATFLTLVAAVYLCATYLAKELRYSVESWKKARRASALLLAGIAVLVPLGIVVTILSTISDQRLSVDRSDTWVSVASLLLIGMVFRQICKHVLDIGKPASTSTIVRLLAADPTRNVGLISFFLLWIGAYALAAYPQISPAYGGGYKDFVVLIPNEGGEAIGKRLALPLQSDGIAIGPVQLLSESAVDYVILPEKRPGSSAHAIKLNRSMFDAVVNVAIPET